MTLRKYIYTAFLLSSFLFIGCSDEERQKSSKSEASLTNSYWKLKSVSGKPIPRPEVNIREAHIVLQDKGVIQGSSGCNRMNGHYTLKENLLKLDGTMMMSRMFCKESIEPSFIKALQSMQSYKIEGEKLNIFDDKGKKLAEFETVYLY